MDDLAKAALEGRSLSAIEVIYASQNPKEMKKIHDAWDAKLRDQKELKAREMQAKADLKRAAETEARAQRLLSELSQRETRLQDGESVLEGAEQELARREKLLNREFRERESNLKEREKTIAPREKALAEKVEKANREIAKAEKLQGEYQEKLAKLREIVA